MPSSWALIFSLPTCVLFSSESTFASNNLEIYGAVQLNDVLKWGEKDSNELKMENHRNVNTHSICLASFFGRLRHHHHHLKKIVYENHFSDHLSDHQRPGIILFLAAFFFFATKNRLRGFNFCHFVWSIHQDEECSNYFVFFFLSLARFESFEENGKTRRECNSPKVMLFKILKRGIYALYNSRGKFNILPVSRLLFKCPERC